MYHFFTSIAMALAFFKELKNKGMNPDFKEVNTYKGKCWFVKNWGKCLGIVAGAAEITFLVL